MKENNIFKRATLLKQIEQNSNWDVIIIGGGATGLGIALDSVTRGFKTLLLEQVDFAKGTSSRSTKLLHGGVRYLAQGNIDLVKEALYERGLLLKNAAHLVNNQTFIIPNYTWWDMFKYTIGLKIYDVLAGKLSFGESIRITKDETISRLSILKNENLKGGVVYHDGQFDDARLAINIAQTAIENGATVLNHFKVDQLKKNTVGIVNGVVAKDMETNTTYTVNAKVVINATGVFTDAILKMDNAQSKDIVRPSQGIHLVLGENSVNFQFNKSTLTVTAKQNLDKLVPVFNEYADTDIKIYGYTDSKGSESYNLNLSSERAAAVKSYLSGKGLSSSRFSVLGMGEAEPIETNDTDAGRSLNRRVEFAIVANDKMIEDAKKEAGK